MIRKLVALLACVMIVLAVWQLSRATAGLQIRDTMLGNTPLTVFRAQDTAGTPRDAAPVVVIAHGFAGSRQLMLPFAYTLARNGYQVVTFDFPGHGGNADPLLGGLAHHEQRTDALLGSLAKVVAFATKLPGADGRVALLGHSMASDVVLRYGFDHPEVLATVAVSVYAAKADAQRPKNLLVIVGAWEPAMLRDEGLRVAGQAAPGKAAERTTYGDFAQGTARRVVFASGVEHIAVLYSRESLLESLAWMDQVFGHKSPGGLDRRIPWLGMLYIGLLALTWALTALLPRLGTSVITPRMQWPRVVPALLLPAILTPLLLWPLPTGFMPILLGDYLTVHFALYGLLTMAALHWLRRRPVPGAAPLPSTAQADPGEHITRSERMTAGPTRAIAWSLLVAAWLIAGLYLPADWQLSNFLPRAGRWPWLVVALIGTALYFIADERLTRDPRMPRGAYALSKLFFLLSLMAAVALNLPKLFFLVIIIPAILVFFLVFGLISGWLFQRTQNTIVGALANAIAFAWAITVTFPLVS